jgi:hypothetical protein
MAGQNAMVTLDGGEKQRVSIHPSFQHSDSPIDPASCGARLLQMAQRSALFALFYSRAGTTCRDGIGSDDAPDVPARDAAIVKGVSAVGWKLRETGGYKGLLEPRLHH